MKLSMKLSAPIHKLKSRAKALRKSESIPLIQALDKIALGEGYASWSLLQSKTKDHLPACREEILDYLNLGDLMLLGARPGLGKTTLAIDLMIQAVEEERDAYLFSLEFTDKDMMKRVERLEDVEASARLNFDFSDEISSDYIIRKTASNLMSGSLMIIDYLQLLDQRRTNPVLQDQVAALKSYAEESRCIIIFLSQIDRAYGGSDIIAPSLEDIRMPNFFDLELFNKILLFNSEKMVFLKPRSFDLNLL
ncbi:MAG: hypothetical protein JKY88_13505 [Pseudomonadales bacterium]|nr:hypothetical protein [Pseudomonadales bacterium]